LGDKHNYNHEDYNSWEEMKKDIIEKEGAAVILPLRIYDHSGVTISTSTSYTFNDRWDSSMVGFIIATKKYLKENYKVKRISKKLIEKATKILLGEIEIYDQYLQGDIYGFQLVEVKHCDKCEDDEEKIIDSCWGFFGDNVKENGMMSYIDDEEILKEIEKAY
jgi:hypothetical protein